MSNEDFQSYFEHFKTVPHEELFDQLMAGDIAHIRATALTWKTVAGNIANIEAELLQRTDELMQDWQGAAADEFKHRVGLAYVFAQGLGENIRDLANQDIPEIYEALAAAQEEASGHADPAGNVADFDDWRTQAPDAETGNSFQAYQRHNQARHDRLASIVANLAVKYDQAKMDFYPPEPDPDAPGMNVREPLRPGDTSPSRPNMMVSGYDEDGRQTVTTDPSQVSHSRGDMWGGDEAANSWSGSGVDSGGPGGRPSSTTDEPAGGLLGSGTHGGVTAAPGGAGASGIGPIGAAGGAGGAGPVSGGVGPGGGALPGGAAGPGRGGPGAAGVRGGPSGVVPPGRGGTTGPQFGGGRPAAGAGSARPGGVPYLPGQGPGGGGGETVRRRGSYGGAIKRDEEASDEEQQAVTWLTEDEVVWGSQTPDRSGVEPTDPEDDGRDWEGVEVVDEPAPLVLGGVDPDELPPAAASLGTSSRQDAELADTDDEPTYQSRRTRKYNDPTNRLFP